ncbi:unnamed protein product [Leptosia nina]|uniref:Uncharacterized protein n=1 Tax=Leptosia nina TaxID=320188 RepID=A0AAV1JNB7_9NEOP
MKLLILLGLIASGYGDKLDRTYLPPPNAGSAGGSPGAITAPGSQFGPAGLAGPHVNGQQSFGPAIGQNQIGQQATQPTGPVSSFSGADSRQPSSLYGPANRPNQPNAGFNSPSETGSNFGSNYPSNFEAPSSSFNQQGQAINSPTFNNGNGQAPSRFSPQNQPERPQAGADRNAEILKYINENDGDRFTYSFETSNGISAEEAGVAADGVRAQGGYSYTGDDGKEYSVTYTADEQGFQPQGEHLPTPHPIPEEILKSIEKNAQAAVAGTQEGAYRPEEYESGDNPEGYNYNANKPQAQGQAPTQQYSSVPNRPIPDNSGFQSTKPFGQSSQTFSNSLDQPQNKPSSFFGSFEPSTQGLGQGNQDRIGQGFGSNNQNQSPRQPGYDYNRPQATQYNTGSRPFSPDSQSRPQSTFSSGQQTSINPFNNPSNSQYTSRPSNQPQQTQFGSTGSFNQANQYSNQPISSTTANQPGVGQFNNINKPSRPQYQTNNQAAVSGNISPNRGPASGVGPIQAPYQYDRPSQSFGAKEQNSQTGFNRPSSQGQYQSNYNRPAQGLQSSFNRPSQLLGSRPLTQGAQSLNQQNYNGPSQGSQPTLYRAPVKGTQTNRPSSQGSFQGNQSRDPSQPGFSNQEQFSGPRQPPSFNAQEGYKY